MLQEVQRQKVFHSGKEYCYYLILKRSQIRICYGFL